MSNVYDVLYVRPKLHKKLKAPQEKLAVAIVASGRMRLDADNESNFTRLLIASENTTLTFTRREMEPKLLKQTHARIMALLAKRYDPKAAADLTAQYIEKINADLKKRHPVKPKIELMMARAFVSCNALPAITLLHLEGAEIYVSYGHSVGDVLDVARWQEVGDNNGLQAIGGGENAIYVSCGGHPFLETDERTHTGDGFPALARFMVIAGQESGHNADMIRDKDGQWVGRYSARDWNRAPSAKSGPGRLADIQISERAYIMARRMGLGWMVEWERHLKFYHDNKLHNWRSAWAWFKSRVSWRIFRLVLRMRGMAHLCTLQRDTYPATLMRRFFEDTLFNLSPQADVYARQDKLEEEAISCIEAVARMPQQAVKWGHRAVYGCTPNLYKLYYGDILKGCTAAIKRLRPQ